MRRLSTLPLLILLVLGFVTSASSQIVNLLPMQNGYVVMTCFSGDYTGPNPNGPVVGIVNVANPPGPFNANWMPPMYHGEFAMQKWASAALGEVFGVCVDAPGNIYVTATTVYGKFPFGPGGGGGVYKINGVTGAISTFASLPNNVDPSATTAPGLGNISWDATNNQFFVTNFEDGKIYRLNSAGTVLTTFDPFAADGGSPGFSPRGERLWGIRVFGNRVYYSVWWEDQGNQNAVKANEIWSVGLNGSGDFVPTDNTKEFDLPGYAGGNWSNPVSDIAFSTDGKRMLVAERVMQGNVQTSLGGWAHSARVLEYSGAHLAWTPFPIKKYRIGVIGDSSNSAGGVDYGYEALSKNGKDDCDSVVWATGDALHFNTPDIVYGLQGMPSTGGSVVNAILIDADGVTNNSDKTQIGDCRVFKKCAPPQEINPCDSIRITMKQAGGSAAGAPGCCWNLTVNNKLAGIFSAIQATVITPGASFGSASAPFGWTNALGGSSTTWTPTGGTIPVGIRDSLIFCLNLAPGTAVPQKVVITKIGHGFVCRDTLTIDCQPPAKESCVSLQRITAKCGQMGPAGQMFDLSFLMQNNTVYTMVGANLTPIGNFTFVPASVTFSPALAPAATQGPFNFTVFGPDAQSGKTICFEVTLHDQGFKHCCTDTFCIKLPVCKDCCTGFKITQGQQVGIQFSATGQVVLSTTLSAGPMPITAASATVVSATIKQGCIGLKPVGSVAADITNATTFAGLPGPSWSIPPIAAGSSREVKWGVSTSGVSVVNAPLKLLIQLPPPPSSPKCSDTVQLCIRYRFTDTSCRTCDTLICYTIVRRGKIIIGTPVPTGASVSALPITTDPNGGETGRTEKHPGQTIEAADEGASISIRMTNSNDGTLHLALAPPPPGSTPADAVTILAVELEPMAGVGPVTINDGTKDYTSVDNVVRVPITIAQGSARDLTLRYTNEARATVFWNDIRIYYRYADQPTDTAVGGFRVTARTPGGMGGDTLVLDTRGGEKRTDVRTYALKFTSDNPSGDGIATVLIRTKGRAYILAVGPTMDSTEVALHFIGNDPGPYVIWPGDVNDGVVTAVRKGQSVGPIYVTVAGADSSSMVFEYETRDANGDAVSRGEVRIDHPISSSVRGDGTPDATGMIALIGSYPNPTKTDVEIRYALTEREPSVWLEVHDVSGRLIATLRAGEAQEPGAYSAHLSTSGMRSGTYYYTLRTIHGTQTRAMTVER